MPTIDAATPIALWRPYPEPESAEQVAAAFDTFWSEYLSIAEWTAARGLPQPSLDEFLQLIAVAWNSLAAWQPDGIAH
jgi:hypothetical protein